MSTMIQGAYAAFTCTNLTQTVDRSSPSVPLSPMVLTTSQNYSRTFTATFIINSPVASSISITSTAPGVTLVRTGDTFTVTSTYISFGNSINNWAYFKLCLQSINIETGPVFPNPAFTIASSITDGTTTLTGTISVGEISATFPTTPGTPTLIRNWNTNIVVNWTGSTQQIGPGVGGYHIYRNGALIASVVGANTLTYTDTNVSNSIEYSYQIQAYDLSAPQLTSGLSEVAVATVASAPTTPGTPTLIRNWNTNIVVNWTGSTQAQGPGVGGYEIYRNGVFYVTVIGANTLSYIDTSVVNSLQYSYQIRAYDTSNPAIVSLLSGAATATAATTPSTPILTFNRTTLSTATLNWTASTQSDGPGIGGYKIYKNGVEIANITGVLSFDVSFTRTTSEILYTVRAYDNTPTTPIQSGISNSGLVTAAKFVMTRGLNETDRVLTSLNGTNWVPQTISGGDTGQWTQIAISEEAIIVASATQNYMARSIDGETWSRTLLPEVASGNNGWDLMVYGNHTWILTDGNVNGVNFYFYSKDAGLTWIKNTLPSVSRWRIMFGGNQFMAYGATGGCFTSPDGVTWTQKTIPFTGASLLHNYGNGRWVFAGTGNTKYQSVDGTTWTSFTLALGVTKRTRFKPAFCYNTSAGEWIITGGVTVGSNDNVVGARSPDGITWSAPATIVVDAFDPFTPQPIFGGNWVTLPNNNNRKAFSTPPTNHVWSATTISISSDVSVGELSYGNGVYIIPTTTGTYTSANGTTWTSSGSVGLWIEYG